MKREGSATKNMKKEYENMKKEQQKYEKKIQ